MQDQPWFTVEEQARLLESQGDIRPGAAAYARAIAQTLAIDLSWASSMLEGGSYSYLGVQALLDYGQAATGKSAEEALMILAHRDAVQYLVDNASCIDVSPQTLGALHEILCCGPAAGDFADIAARAQAIADSFEQSIHLLAITPDRRLGRLACNIPLLRHSLAPFSFLEVGRFRYNQALKACARGDIEPLKAAYIECYLATVARYHVQTARDPAAIELEARRRADIQRCLQSYVAASIGAGRRLDAVDYARQRFSGDPAVEALADRIAAIAAALTDASCIAYGISRQDFARLSMLPPIH